MELGMGVEEESSRGDWGDENLQDGSITLAVNEGNDPLDGDWLPYALTKSKKRRTGESLQTSSIQFLIEDLSQSGPKCMQKALI